ncbi:hypothetical protein HRbin03_00234 [archaeon HR03]|nr:hypothetical protein HRbin03_00234 [archaeon HR03]
MKNAAITCSGVSGELTPASDMIKGSKTAKTTTRINTFQKRSNARPAPNPMKNHITARTVDWSICRFIKPGYLTSPYILFTRG